MILELQTFDYALATQARLLSSAGLWMALPRITRLGTARLLMVADTLRAEDVLTGFQEVATPEAVLPPEVLAYRMQYEGFLQQVVQDVRYMRLFLLTDSTLSTSGFVGTLGAYGIRARPLEGALPRPFHHATTGWRYLTDENGLVWGALRSRFTQSGMVHPRFLHNLLGLDFPLWVALDIATWTNRRAMRELRQKAAAAGYAAGNMTEIAEAGRVAEHIQTYMEALAQGEMVHTVQLRVLFQAPSPQDLGEHAEMIRGTLPWEMEWHFPPHEVAGSLFTPPTDTDGTPMTTTGATLLAASALSYRRRTETSGVLLGVDRNQSPVVLDVFDDRNPSYNTVVLGQTGAGKTFATLLLMVRHLLLGVRLIIIDPQGNIDLSFLGPDIVQRSVLGTPQAAINILDRVHDDLSAQVEMAIAMLSMLGVHSNTPTERGLLDEALMALYTGDEKRTPLLSDLENALASLTGRLQTPALRDSVEALRMALQPFCHGSKRALFGGATTVDLRLEHPVNIFDVSQLPQDGEHSSLRAAMLAVLVASINRGIRHRRQQGDRAPMLFFVDEMGILMRDPIMASYISQEYKTARARLVGMIVADQDLHSLLGPADPRTGLHHGIPILANAANTLLFKSKESERERIREHFPMMPAALIDALPALQRGVCVAKFADEDLLVVHVTPSPLETVLLSSRLQDRAVASQLIGQILSEIRLVREG